MRINLDHAEGYVIRSYREGAVVVNDRLVQHAVILTPEQLLQWPPRDFAELSAAHFDPILQLEPELVLLGTGTRQQFPHPSLTRKVLERGIGVEVMDTAAACRTYNIIMAEGRAVAAALLMI